MLQMLNYSSLVGNLGGGMRKLQLLIECAGSKTIEASCNGSFFCEALRGIWMLRNNMIFNGVKLSDISFRVAVTCSDSTRNLLL